MVDVVVLVDVEVLLDVVVGMGDVVVDDELLVDEVLEVEVDEEVDVDVDVVGLHRAGSAPARPGTAAASVQSVAWSVTQSTQRARSSTLATAPLQS